MTRCQCNKYSRHSLRYKGQFHDFHNMLNLRTFSIIFAKPGFMSDTLLSLALPSFWCHSLFQISILSFSPNCWFRWCASHDLVRPFTPWLFMNAPIVSRMTYAMHGVCLFNAGHSNLEPKRVDCNSQGVEELEKLFSVIIRTKQPSVSSKWSRTSFKCSGSHAQVYGPFTCHSWIAFEEGTELAINLIESKLKFAQCPFSIYIVSNDWRCG